MERYVVRVWLPDRPGALGHVASRIGALRGDVVGIEILERGAGRAVDELVVALPDPSLIGQLVAEVSEVEGVDVEDVHRLGQADHDPQLGVLEAASRVVEARGAREQALARLCADVAGAFEAEWAAAVVGGRLEQAAGDVPDETWLVAFLAGARHLDGDSEHGPHDVVWADLGPAGALCAGRTGRPFRSRERRQLSVLARLAGSALGLAVTPPAASPARPSANGSC